MKSKKRILVAPLNWGIGHATRCIPIIENLIKNDFDVLIATSGRPLQLLQEEFPNIKSIEFKDYNINYSSYLPMFFLKNLLHFQLHCLIQYFFH